MRHNHYVRRECFITLPVLGNAGEDLASIHEALGKEICKLWGGYTAIPCEGAWLADDGTLYRERVIRYTVAVVDQVAAKARLRDLAHRFGTLAGQLAMYVGYPDGTVEIIDLPQPAA